MTQTKLAAYDLAPAERNPEMPLGTETLPDNPVPEDIQEPTTAVEAVRYLFLANELRRLGQHSAADRWWDKAMSWVTRLSDPVED